MGWWLPTEYLPMDCHSIESAPGVADCDYTVWTTPMS
jgi:hypothetical protein